RDGYLGVGVRAVERDNHHCNHRVNQDGNRHEQGAVANLELGIDEYGPESVSSFVHSPPLSLFVSTAPSHTSMISAEPDSNLTGACSRNSPRRPKYDWFFFE